MQAAALLAALFSAPSLGAILPKMMAPRNVTATFSVTSFYASCIPHSVMCSYSFNVSTTPTSEPTICSSFLMGPDYLPEVGLTGCSDPTVSWSFATGNDYTLLLTTFGTAGANITGSRLIPDAEVIVENHGAVNDQRYIGSQNFSITAS